MAKGTSIQTERLTLAEKKANDFQWYKDKMNQLDTGHYDLYTEGGSDVSEYRRMQVNYDLFNNKLNLSDFNHVCKPYGAEAGELPAQMVNRDISSGKIKSVLGMESKRPFQYKVIATNSEATTRIEQEEFSRIKKFVIDDIMGPIRKQVEIKYQEQIKGGQLSEEELRQLQQQMESEIQSQTPAQVKTYMEREHQDPAEVMAHQLLEYLSRTCDLKKKFNKAFKHLHLSAKEVLYVGIMNGHPEVWNVNSLRFSCDLSPDLDFIEDGEFCTNEYRMTPSTVIGYFGKELTNQQIDEVYSLQAKVNVDFVRDGMFSFDVYNDNDYAEV